MSEPPARCVVGFDLGGSKCAVSRLREDGSVQETIRISTGDFEPTFKLLTSAARELLHGEPADAGISCGGPLDAKKGIILSPPNLPESWYGVPICRQVEETLGARACLMNDANACALAEWKFGAGRGARHMIFLTSGTGMGGGLILNGKLYEGATGDAGEIGHVRLKASGPMGYGKAGSVEGFCSGGGIARLAGTFLSERKLPRPEWWPIGTALTTKQVAEAARAGDTFAMEVMTEAGHRLGDALAILIDLFNPERIVLGGFYPRCRDILEPALRSTMHREALPIPAGVCQILPAELGETIGSCGAIAAALHTFGP